MQKYYCLLLLIASTTFSSCSWLSSFFIINNTSKNIIVTYTLKPTADKDYAYALKDTLIFTKLRHNENINDDKILGNHFTYEYSKQLLNGNENYSVTILPKTAMSSGYRIPFFTFSNTEERHKIFNNLIEMTIVRIDANDTIKLNSTLLPDFSRQFGEHQIALIFD